VILLGLGLQLLQIAFSQEMTVKKKNSAMTRSFIQSCELYFAPLKTFSDLAMCGRDVACLDYM